MRIYIARILLKIVGWLTPKESQEHLLIKALYDCAHGEAYGFPVSANEARKFDLRKTFAAKNFAAVALLAQETYLKEPQYIRHTNAGDFHDLNLNEKSAYIDRAIEELYAKNAPATS